MPHKPVNIPSGKKGTKMITTESRYSESHKKSTRGNYIYKAGVRVKPNVSQDGKDVEKEQGCAHK